MEYIYAALLLHKLGKEIDEDGLKKVISATGTEVDEGKVKLLVANLKGLDIENELANAMTLSAAPTAASEAPKEEKKEEKKAEKEEAAAEGLSSLFG